MKIKNKLPKYIGGLIVFIIIVLATSSAILTGSGTSSGSQPVPSSPDTFYSGQHTKIAIINLSSDDQIIYGQKPEQRYTNSLASSPNIRYTNDGQFDGNLSPGYQVGDDVLQISEITNTTRDLQNINAVMKFPKDIIFINKQNDSVFRYDSTEDIYHVTPLTGKPNISTNGTIFRTFSINTRFLDNSNLAKFDGSQPIIGTSDNKVDISDTVLKDGTSDSLSNFNDSHIQLISDSIGTTGYDSDGLGNFGEPLYRTAGDNSVDAGIDKRVSPVYIFSNSDTNVSTIDLGFELMRLVQSGAQDMGISLYYTKFSPSICEIDPDTGTSSGIGTIEESDSIIINIDGNQYYNSSKDVLIQGNVQNGTKYDHNDFLGSWKNGTDSYGNSVVIFDKGNNTDSNTDDILIGAGTVSIGPALLYSNTVAKIKYLETKNNSIFDRNTDGLFVDFGSDGISPGDLRLSNYSYAHNANTTVRSEDLDNGLQATSIPNFNKYIDTNANDQFDIFEPIIDSNNLKLNSSDNIIVNESSATSLTNFSYSGSLIYLYQGLGKYSYPEPIV
ncbi:MAG: hypothetical protein ABEI86_03875, partial [Halobacteriaceae archaeon]